MTFIPIEILSLIIGVSFALPLIGYLYRTAFPMSAMFFIVGASWLIIFLTTDSIGLGDRVATINATTDIIGVTYEDNEYEVRNTITLEPTLIGLLFIIFSVSMIVIGVLIEEKFK